jgi:hypothetical protein
VLHTTAAPARSTAPPWPPLLSSSPALFQSYPTTRAPTLELPGAPRATGWLARARPSPEPRPPRPPPGITVRRCRLPLRSNFECKQALGEHTRLPVPLPGRERRRCHWNWPEPRRSHPQGPHCRSLFLSGEFCVKRGHGCKPAEKFQGPRCKTLSQIVKPFC